VYLAGSWFHAVKLEHKGQNWLQWYFWPAVALWALDRALRFARLFWNNTRWRRSSDAGKYARGTVELLSADTLRLTLTRRMDAWTPGQHAYLVLPGVSTLPTEAHPFTIASAPHSFDGTPGPAEKELVFVVRTRDGFTGRLRERARDGKFEVQALVDGPYGTPPDLSGYSTVVLIAGQSFVALGQPDR
jgi:ferric-chelate reductase